MNQESDPISVFKYDMVAKLLTAEPKLTHEDVARRCRVATLTVERIWDGSIRRPAVVVLKRLSRPKRCPSCGGLCRDWPCIFCEMHRRKSDGPLPQTPRFQYRTRSR